MNQSKRKFKGALSGFMATALTASFLPLPEAKANSFYDVNSYDWYATSVARWSTAGIVHGTGDNLFSPDGNVTRGQIAVMINNIMGYEVQSQALFSDLLDPSAFYYTPLRYLAAAGVVSGRDDGTMGAEDDVTRQEAAVMLCEAFHLEMSENTYTTFADNSQIASYALPAVVTLNELAVLNGTPDNLVMPRGSLTRAEFATMLNALISSLTYHNGQTVARSINTSNQGGTTIVNTDTTVSGSTIYGNMIIAPGLSYGDVYLDDLSITGNLYVRGGGVESVYVDDVEIMGHISVGRDKDAVRVVFSGSTKAPSVSITNDCVIDNSELTTEGYITDLSIESGENIEIIGTYDTLVNDSTGANITIDGSISEITMNASGTINGVTVAAGTSFDSNSIPGLDIEEPNITLTHNYGSALDDAENDPYAESEVMTIEYDSATGEVVATIRVEDEEDCVLMSEAQNAITVYNPNDLTSLSNLELTVERKDYSSYTEFEVSFIMTQNYSEIPLSVNFKDKYAAPEVNIIMNFNDLPKASAEYEINDLTYSTSTGTAKATIDLTEIKYCEPHYLEEYAITFDEDLFDEDPEFSISKMSYDDEESTAYFNIEFNGEAVDSIDLTVNMLKTDAQDEIPAVEAILYHSVDEKDEGELSLEYAVLNAQGLMEIKVILDDLGDHTLLTSSKAITIMAESDEPEYGYGLNFDYELIHDGAVSYYIITFTPSTDVEEVIFMINVEDLDENIPKNMSGLVNLSRITDHGTYVEINMNSRSFSRSQVTVEVAVDLEALEDISGYEIDSSDPFTPIAASTAEGEEITDYTVTKIEDGLYSVKFTPAYNVVNDVTTPITTNLRLNLEQTTGYVGLFPVTNLLYSTGSNNSVPLENLAYTSLATSSSKEGFDYTVSFNVVALTGTTFNKNANIAIRPKVELDPEDEDYVEYLESDYVTDWQITSQTETKYNSGLSQYKITIDIDTYLRTRPADLAFNITDLSSTTLSGDSLDPDFIMPYSVYYDTDIFAYSLVSFNETDGIFKFTLTDKDEKTEWYDFDFDITYNGSATDQSGFSWSFSGGVYTFTLKLDEYARESASTLTILQIPADDLFEEISVDVSSKLHTFSTASITAEVDQVESVNTATYTMDVEIPSTYALDSTKIDDSDLKGAFAFTTTNVNIESVTKKPDVVGKPINTTYTVIFTVTDSSIDELELSVDLEYASAPQISDLTISTGFTGNDPKSGSVATITRDSSDYTQLTWELKKYDTSDESYQLTTVDLGLVIQPKNGKTLYYSTTDPITEKWDSATTLDTLNPGELVTDETKTYYFSYNANGVKALEVEISCDVATAEEPVYSIDSVVLSEETVAKTGKTYDGLRTYFTGTHAPKLGNFIIDSEVGITKQLTIGPGMTLTLGEEFDLNTLTTNMIKVQNTAILTYMGEKFVTGNTASDIVQIKLDDESRILVVVKGTVYKSENDTEDSNKWQVGNYTWDSKKSEFTQVSSSTPSTE